MGIRSRLRSVLAPSLKKYRSVWSTVIAADHQIEKARHTAGRVLPTLIRPEPRSIEIAITALCNLRCVGCRYGRDFMTGSQLSWPVVRDLLDDAKALGIWNVRFYGGEPLIHRDLPRMIAHATGLGLQTHVTTNAVLLRDKIVALHDAGLRAITIGFYGTGARYDEYVQRTDRFRQVEAGIAAVRDRYGMGVDLRINWLLMRPSCNLADLHAAYDFAKRYDLRIQIDLVHYSLPYFSEGPNRELQFRAEDAPQVDQVVTELLRLKHEDPDRFNQSPIGLRSISDWLLKGPDMRVPCDAYQMLWVGADATVQLCYVTFRLGNLHEHRLRDMMFTPAHRAAASDAFALNCPNCHCHYERRVLKHGPSQRKYAQLLARGN
jgi:MoaA/NifB/PqqE/SkfB family radical SAM enzyme